MQKKKDQEPGIDWAEALSKKYDLVLNFLFIKNHNNILRIYSTNNGVSNTLNICLLSYDYLKKQDISTSKKPKSFPSFLKSIEEPILFIGVEDFFNPDLDENSHKSIKKYYDPRYRFFDSSIWFRYISIPKLEGTFKDRLKEFRKLRSNLEEYLRQKKEYENQGYYKPNEAKEFREFAIRQFNESYIQKINKSGGHSGHIAPYGFHSEGKAKKWSEDEASMIKEFKWNICLIDDGMSDDKEKKKKLIEGFFTQINICVTHLDVLPTKNSIKEQVIQKNYDLILLDYYFKPIKGEPAQFGEEFLIELLNVEKEYLKEENLGPTGKIWIFPVSVYSTALVDKLRDNHLAWYSDKWVIAPGADPLNTPYLFQYMLFNFMRTQLMEFAILEDDELVSALGYHLIQFMHKVEKQTEELTKISAWIPRESKLKPASINDIQKQILDIFPKIVELGVKFKRLHKRKSGHQNFSNSVIKEFFFNLEHYDWDHFQNLIYLVGYGNKSNADQIWNELSYLKRKFDPPRDNSNKNNYNDAKGIFKHFISIITQYIA